MLQHRLIYDMCVLMISYNCYSHSLIECHEKNYTIMHERSSNTKYINPSKNSSRLYLFSLIKSCPNAQVQSSHTL